MQTQGHRAGIRNEGHQFFIRLLIIIGRHQQPYLDAPDTPGVGGHDLGDFRPGAIDADAAVADANGDGGEHAGGQGSGAKVCRRKSFTATLVVGRGVGDDPVAGEPMRKLAVEVAGIC